MTNIVQLMKAIRNTIGPNQKFRSLDLKNKFKSKGWSDGSFNGAMNNLKNKNLIYNDAERNRNYRDQCNWWYRKEDIGKIDKFIKI